MLLIDCIDLDKIEWCNLCTNKNAIQFLEQNLDKDDNLIKKYTIKLYINKITSDEYFYIKTLKTYINNYLKYKDNTTYNLDNLNYIDLDD